MTPAQIVDELINSVRSVEDADERVELIQAIINLFQMIERGERRLAYEDPDDDSTTAK